MGDKDTTVDVRPGKVSKVGKSAQPPDSVGPRHAAAVRQAMIEAAGYTPDDLARARKAKLEALDATDEAGNADHSTRLKAANALDQVILPQVHGNAQGGGRSVLELDFSPWLRKALESRRSSP